QAEAGVLCRHDQVAGQHDLAAASERRAVHRGNPGLGTLGEHEAGEPPALGPKGIGTAGCDLLQVGARAKSLPAGAGKDDDPDVRVGLQLRNRGVERPSDCLVDGVARMRSIDRDERRLPRQALDQDCRIDGIGAWCHRERSGKRTLSTRASTANAPSPRAKTLTGLMSIEATSPCHSNIASPRRTAMPANAAVSLGASPRTPRSSGATRNFDSAAWTAATSKGGRSKLKSPSASRYIPPSPTIT